MKLPTFKKPNLSRNGVAGLIVGLVLGATGLVVANSNAPTTPGQHGAGPTQATPVIQQSDQPANGTETAPSDTLNPSTAQTDTPSNTSPGIIQNSTPAAPNQDSTASSPSVPAAPTVTGVSQSRSQQGDQTIFNCHYTMSDGTSYDKVGGQAPNADVIKYGIDIGCPAS